GGESEDGFAETDETDVRVKLLRDIAGSREWAEHKTADPRAVSELCSLVGWVWSRQLPILDVGRVDVVVPSSPIIPGNEDRNPRPEPALHDSDYLVYGPLHTCSYVDNGALSWVGMVFVKMARSVEPGHVRELSS